MVTQLLQEIRDFLSGTLGSVIGSLADLLKSLADVLSAISDQAEDIKQIEENTEPIVDIKDEINYHTELLEDLAASNAHMDDTILVMDTKLNTLPEMAKNVTAIRSSTTRIDTRLGIIASDTAATAAYAEQIATNTLEIKNHQISMDADTTEIIALLRRILEKMPGSEVTEP